MLLHKPYGREIASKIANKLMIVKRMSNKFHNKLNCGIGLFYDYTRRLYIHHDTSILRNIFNVCSVNGK
jgi:hypothetical protein